jgi:kynureninase
MHRPLSSDTKAAMHTPAQAVVQAQLHAFAQHKALARRPILSVLQEARDPRSISRLLTESSRAGFPTLPMLLRAQYAAELGISGEELDFRALYPGLDIGIYACSHSMGVPSIVGPAAITEQLYQLATKGIQVWEGEDEGNWVQLMELYREKTAELVGGSLQNGDVCWFQNVSDALSAILEGIPGGKLVFTSGHFTTGHYVHHRWAANTGGHLIEVPTNEDGSVPTARLLEAITPDTTVVSISHALFESGWLQDLPAIAAEVRKQAPEALLLVDAYQTAGTVPIEADVLGDQVMVTAGGHKQLRSATGAAFAYIPKRWFGLTARRTGWWAHAAPFAFEKGPVRLSEDASRFRTGTPGIHGMAMLCGELLALGVLSEGSLKQAVQQARKTTASLVERMLAGAAARDLKVRGDFPAERRGAFICVEVKDGAINHQLAAQGIITDFRPKDTTKAGWLRVSGNAAAFGYELDAVLDAIQSLS